MHDEGRVLLPGPGLARSRDGARDRRGGAGGDGGLSRRLGGDGDGPRPSLLRGAPRGARRDGGPAADARRHEPRDPGRGAQGGHRARHRRRPLGRRVRRARLGTRDVGRRGDRPRPRARARHGRGGEAAAGGDGRDPRPRGPACGDALPEDPRRVAGELQLPRPDRRLGRKRRGRGVLRRGREPRRATSDQAKGLGRVSQPPRRTGRAGPQARDRQDPLQRSRRAVHVDGDGEDRARPAARLAARRPADRAGPLHAGGGRAHARRRHDVRRDRAGQRPLRPCQADRPRRPHVLGERPREPREGQGGAERPVSSFASLEGKLALVTGGSRGIGRAIALELGRAGAEVVVGYRTGRDDAVAVAEEIGGRAVEADVSDAESAAALVEAAGDVDVLVNNAGLTRDGLLVRMSDEDWRTVIDTNLSSVFYTCRAAARPMMRKRSGTIVNISSIVGVHGNWGQTNYAASKAGIIGFTKSLARELGSRNVRANVVAPGYVKTQLTDVLPEEATRAMLTNTPLGRLGDPEDVAGAVRFLCSDAAKFVTGDVLLVDGGLGM